MPTLISSKETISSLVKIAVESYAIGFQARHEGEIDNPNGTLNMKIHNVFIAELGPEIQYYTALVRSLDSSLGNMLESLAVSIARLNFEVHKNVQGVLSPSQIVGIAELLEKYKRREKKPDLKDYEFLQTKPIETDLVKMRHDSDYYLINKTTQEHFLIELKIGGDLDNKKARSEKEAILEQYGILSNTLPTGSNVKAYFATAYNRFGEDKPWKQERVRQFFAEDELLIGRKFWDFVCQMDDGYEVVLGAFKKCLAKFNFGLEYQEQADHALFQGFNKVFNFSYDQIRSN